ncbi:haloacid dehalogenase-like hydrolase [Phenylobacterium sp. J426]|uniref:HAD family hydrolase n=1 Tax=Phenylobacterium sp. J426 TaxID=2898439 RepID=UPI002150FCFA|nr:HAD family hydrolase [Phenylobacterium sp. J426]MCR5875583.1 haloacid dehalogenase-like hydrolase [Phenylobacterium sp. J426]
MNASPRPLAVFAYDFDGTLAPGNMQEHAFIPDELGLDHAEFWAETRRLAEAQRGDGILAYMHLMLEKAREKDLELSRDSWRKRGASLRLFPGVEDWFGRQNARAEALGLDLRHFIISSGNRELIEGSPIADRFERIYASAFMFNAEDEAVGAALAINYTGKTQYLFRINKWTLDEWDNDAINAVQPDRDRAVPFSRIAFFGDGLTDIPVMRVMTDHGGHPVAVYDPETPITEAAADKLIKDGRARLAAGGDYREGSELDGLAADILAEMARGVRADLFD